MALDVVKLLASVDNVVVRSDTCYSLIAGIGFHNGLERMIQLRKDSVR